jgi:folate-dependent phosphoribosylglycinamide formyltransferase PurN
VLTVIGQLAFQLLMVRILKVLSKKRINDIKSIYRLDETPIPSVKVKRVVSANAPETIELLERLSPDLVIVNGTRILSKRVISCVPCRFINTHAGITPRYRGVHGMYWALANDDLAHSGVTVHFVDNGIDTGEIINQKAVSPTKDDNFATYPYLQLGAGIEILIESIYRYFNDAITTRKGTEDSNLWYHPTLWFYLYNRLIRGVK